MPSSNSAKHVTDSVGDNPLGITRSFLTGFRFILLLARIQQKKVQVFRSVVDDSDGCKRQQRTRDSAIIFSFARENIFNVLHRSKTMPQLQTP